MSELLEQPCNKSDIFVKLVTSCQQVWNNLLINLEQAVRTHLLDDLSADLFQVVRFLRVYNKNTKSDIIQFHSAKIAEKLMLHT